MLVIIGPSRTYLCPTGLGSTTLGVGLSGRARARVRARASR